MSKILPVGNSVAIYCRLSREDGDSSESSSISTQKQMLTEFALKNNWNIFDFYIDDGYSGGNFNRPEFQRLLTDIEACKISIVLTKDLSRLGRNYIQVGYYTEEYFPEHNVRYIALNDNYDSTDEENDFTPFKNIINQWYLKDISKKVKSSINMRMKQGKFQKGNKTPLYGYKFDEEDNRIIDVETADNVRLIFNLYKQGTRLVDIMKYLEDNKILNPGYYYYKKYNYNPSKWIANEHLKYHWQKSTLIRMLTNEEYTGKLIMNKRKTINYKTHQKVPTTKDEQYVFEDKFEPIISKQLFNEIQLLRTYKSRAKPNEDNHLLLNILCCENCGSPLYFIKRNETSKKSNYFYCRCKKCNLHAYINENTIQNVLNQELKSLHKIITTQEKEMIKYALDFKKRKEENSSIANYQKEINTLNTRNEKLNSLIEKLFESNVLGELPVDIYKKLLNNYKTELDANNEKIKIYFNILNDHKCIDYEIEVKTLINTVKANFNKPLTKEYLQCIYSKVLVKKVNNVNSVNFKYNRLDEFLKEYFKYASK